MSDISNYCIIELSMSTYPCVPNFSATGHLEPKIGIFNISSWRPYWNSRWRPVHWLDLLDPPIFEISAPKYPCMRNFTLSARNEHLFHISAPLLGRGRGEIVHDSLWKIPRHSEGLLKGAEGMGKQTDRVKEGLVKGGEGEIGPMGSRTDC